MNGWFLGTLSAMVTFGAWGFFPKLAVNYVSPQSALIYQVIGGFFVGIVGLAILNFKPETHPMGIVYAFLTGITGVFGTLFALRRSQQGPDINCSRPYRPISADNNSACYNFPA